MTNVSEAKTETWGNKIGDRWDGTNDTGVFVNLTEAQKLLDRLKGRDARALPGVGEDAALRGDQPAHGEHPRWRALRLEADQQELLSLNPEQLRLLVNLDEVWSYSLARPHADGFNASDDLAEAVVEILDHMLETRALDWLEEFTARPS